MRRLLHLALLLALAAAGYGVAAWFDVVPGGWTLRGWVVPHPVREARRWAAHREARLAAFAAEPAAPAGAVVFLGSSTVERFPLAERFPGVPCVNRGVGNEDLANLMDRLEASLPAATPAGLVLYAASIDFRVHRTPPRALADGVGGLLDRLAALAPGVPVALIGVLPEQSMPPEMAGRLARTNELLAQTCEQRGAAFVATDRPPITDPDGSLSLACAADHLHLNAAGYDALSGWLIADGGAVGALLGR